jgi:hypothetical protein
MTVRICLAVLVLACLGTAGCRSQVRSISPQPVVSGEVAPGRIVVDILEPRGREHYYVYEVRPSKGSLNLTSEETFKDYQHERISHEYQRPTGAIDDCISKKPTAESPDGNYVAGCTVDVQPGGRFSRIYYRVFFINEKNTGQEVFHWRLDEQRLIHGFAWSLNSRSIALLDSTEVYGKGPLEMIWAWAGHPVPHNTVYLHIIPVSTMQPGEYKIRSDVLYAFTVSSIGR